jgi:hypothetical protein
VAFRINRTRVSTRPWSEAEELAIRERLANAPDEAASHEVYATRLASGSHWGAHHEVSSDGEIILNRQALQDTVATLGDLGEAERTVAIRHLSQHFVEHDLPLPEGFVARAGEMHVLAGIVGEMAPRDIPLSTAFTEAERQHLLKGDDDPMEVVIEIAPGKSSRGWNYTPQALQKMVTHVQAHTLAGIKGHQRDEDVASQFVDPATHWIGAVWQNDKAYFRGVIDKTAPDLKRWIRAKRITQPSIFTRPVITRVGGETQVVDLEPLGIDWAPLDRAGMNTARVVAWGEMDAIGGEPFESRAPMDGDHIPTQVRSPGHMTTVREALDALRENGATASQVMQAMNWRAVDVLPGLLASDRRGVAEGLDQATLAHVAAGEMARAHRPQELLQGLGLDLAAVAPLVDEAQWKRLQASDLAVGEMRGALGLPETADAAAVRTRVSDLLTAVQTTSQQALRTSVESIVARGEMAVPTAVRPLVTSTALLELQPGADEAAIKVAIGKAKTAPEIKPILEAGLLSAPIRPTSSGVAGEMHSGGQEAVGLPLRRRSI